MENDKKTLTPMSDQLVCPNCKALDWTTLKTSLCRDCGSPANLNEKGEALANLCRKCCPTGHGTKSFHCDFTKKGNHGTRKS